MPFNAPLNALLNAPLKADDKNRHTGIYMLSL